MLTDTLKGALEKEPNAFRYHFRNFPLDRTCNPTWSPDVAPGNSCLTAYATVCADAQQKFWAMHDRLFENQVTLQNMEEGKAGATLNAFAKEIGLDMASFESCYRPPRRRTGYRKISQRHNASDYAHPTVVHGRGSAVE